MDKVEIVVIIAIIFMVPRFYNPLLNVSEKIAFSIWEAARRRFRFDKVLEPGRRFDWEQD